MVGIVVGDQHRLSKDCLAITVRDFFEEVDFRIVDKVDHRLPIILKGLNALVPGRFCRRGIRSWPIALGEMGRDVFLIR